MWRVTVRLVAPMICSWRDFVRRDADWFGRRDRRRPTETGVAPLCNDNQARELPGAARMGDAGDRQFALVLSLARMLLATRGQFALALRDLSSARSGCESPNGFTLRIIEQKTDEAIYALARGGSAVLEETLRRAIDDIAKEIAMERSGAPRLAD